MKRIIVFARWIAFCCVVLTAGCGDTGNRTQSAEKQHSIHFFPAGSGPVEPIALVGSRGVYRLFYPVSHGVGPGRIVQAVTKDLIHWSSSPAISIPQFRDSVFHGGIVVDSNNLSGYGGKQKAALIAVLPTAPFLAFSTNEGETWTAAAVKPDLPKEFIDNPQNCNILWHAPTRKWIMSLAIADHMEFYSSPDLHTWRFESSVGGDFFPEEVKWRRAALYPCADKLHWVLLADIKKEGKAAAPGGTVYFVGSFDGHSFVNESAQLHWLDYGEDVYTSLVTTGEDGHEISIGWKDDTGRQPITIPRKLELEDMQDQWIIAAAPVRRLKAQYGQATDPGPVTVSYKTAGITLASGVSAPMEVFLKFATGGIQKGSFPLRFGVRFRNDKGEGIAFVFDRFGYYYLDRSGLAASAGGASGASGGSAGREPVKMPFDHADSTMSFHFIVDHGIIECFAEGGKLVMTGTFPLDENFNKIELFSVNGDIGLLEASVIELKAPL
jgi:fructan beta-fructosidase